MGLDHTKASVEPDEYKSDKTGELVKTWAMKGLTGWKSVSVRQGDEVEACKILDVWRQQLGRVAAIRVKLDEAQVKLSLAMKSRNAFMVIYQKYPGKLEAELAAENEAVKAAEDALEALMSGE